MQRSSKHRLERSPQVGRPDVVATAGTGGGAPSRGQLALAALLFVLTFFSTTTLGAVWWVAAQTDRSTSLEPWRFLSPETVGAVWTDPDYLTAGLTFSLPLLVILLAHELGHYLVCRRYGLPATPPYFLPAPIALGTLGAFIKIRAPIADKRQLLDVGIGGPLAGFAALLPFLVYGISRSEIATIAAASPPVADALLFLPGDSLVMTAVTYMFHGPLEPTQTLNLHPTALAAWVGLLATALNLLPLGQLDGGHILYATSGRYQHRLAVPLWVALALCGFLWPGWILWCLVLLVIGLRHPPVVDEAVRLDPRRLRLAVAGGIVFVVSFMPVPIALIEVAG